MAEAMTSREIVAATLDYTGPERVARSFSPSDFVGAHTTAPTYATEWQKASPHPSEVGFGKGAVQAGEAWTRIDEWGNVWRRIDSTSKGEVARGVLDSLDKIESYEFPDFSQAKDYTVVREQRAAHPDSWLIGGLPGFAFNIARKMRRFEQYLMDILLERERIALLHDRIDDVLETMIRNYAAAGVDAVMLVEDWGTQKQTLISPRLWREEFFPRFVRLCDVAHASGVKVFMHSCGQIQGIVPGLIEAGIDLLQFDQPDLHTIDLLAARQDEAREQGKRITFWCGIDIQITLQTRDRAIIEAKAREMLDRLWRGEGGFVAGYYSDNASIGLEPSWQDYASATFAEYGVRSRYR
jgi:uroporphyrinogen decarboxylase